MSTGDFPESSTQAMLVGTMLVGKLGVRHDWASDRACERPSVREWVSACVSEWVSEWVRKGGWCGWEASSSSNFSIRAFGACPLVELRRTVPCRAIRGNCISVNSTLPPSYECQKTWIKQENKEQLQMPKIKTRKEQKKALMSVMLVRWKGPAKIEQLVEIKVACIYIYIYIYIYIFI